MPAGARITKKIDELKKPPESFFDASGKPNLGAYCGEFKNLESLSQGFVSNLFRKKTWVWIGIFNPQGVYASLAIVHAGYVGRVFGHLVNGSKLDHFNWTTPLGLSEQISGSVHDLQALSQNGKDKVEVRAMKESLLIQIATEKFQGELEIFFEGEPLSVLSHLSLNGNPGLTIKQAGLKAQGFLIHDGKKITFDDSSGAYDRTLSFFPFFTKWHWLMSSGTLNDKRRFGLNLSVGVHEGPGFSENAVWVDGNLHALPKIYFDQISARTTNTWRIFTLNESRYPHLALDFQPLAGREAEVNLGVFASSLKQIFGRLHGKISLSDSNHIHISDITSIIEDHSARW